MRVGVCSDEESEEDPTNGHNHVVAEERELDSIGG